MKSTLFFIISISIILSCTKDEKKITTPEPLKYNNKFFFYWNGVPLYDSTDVNYQMDAGGIYFKNSDYLGAKQRLRFKSSDNVLQFAYEFYFAVQPFKLGYQDFYTHRYQPHITKLDDFKCGMYYVVPNLPSFMNVTYIDKRKNIIRGYFSFTAANKCLDTLHVTDGYFDLNYKISE